VRAVGDEYTYDDLFDLDGEEGDFPINPEGKPFGLVRQ